MLKTQRGILFYVILWIQFNPRLTLIILSGTRPFSPHRCDVILSSTAVRSCNYYEGTGGLQPLLVVPTSSPIPTGPLYNILQKSKHCPSCNSSFFVYLSAPSHHPFSNRPFHAFFQILTCQTSWGKSLDTTEKSALRLVKLPRLKVKVIQLLKVAKFYRRLYGAGHKLALHHTSVCKFSQLCGAISLLA